MKKWLTMVLVLMLMFSPASLACSEEKLLPVTMGGLTLSVPMTCHVDIDKAESIATIIFGSDDVYMLWQFIPASELNCPALRVYASNILRNMNADPGVSFKLHYENTNDGSEVGVMQGGKASRIMYYVMMNDKGAHVFLCDGCGEITEKKAARFDRAIKSVAPSVSAQAELDYKGQCEPCTYKAIARNPEKVKGKKVVLSGKVIQVIEEEQIVNLRVDITETDGRYKDTIYVTYTRKSTDEDRILEDDIITMWGVLGGLKTYETIFRSQETIPLLEAQYIQIDSLSE